MVSLLLISLLYLGIMLIAAKISEEIFRRIGLVTFVGPILMGILLGNGVFGVIQINEIISFITSLGIVFLLFLAGAEEFNVENRPNANVFLAVILESIIPFSVILVAIYIIGFKNYLILIVPLAMSSAGPLSRMLMDVKISDNRISNLIFQQVILIEIIFVILFAILLKTSEILITIIEIFLVFAFTIMFGRTLAKILEKIEYYFKAREIEFASLIAIILIIGYLAELYKFNSAISAFFLGILLKDYLKDRPELLERLHAFTYGFFEPLFFLGIGLYVTKINASIILFSLLFFSLIIASKFLAGFISSKILNIKGKINGFATSVKGGVDSSLLLTGLTLGYINEFMYSFSILAISLSALIVPLLFQINFKISNKISESKKVKLSQEVIKLQIKPLYASCEENLRSVISKISERGVRGIVVVNYENKPLGYVSIQTLLEIDPELYGRPKITSIKINL
ncbi:CBS domain-containing protein [Saccharolobus solfataricus]|uniref:CBS domain-containing protein n=1 Tax=Saccharolobus solfataricus TaxID=2287 RepID=A0A3G2LQV0_SACSO|nr:CBS domain-containing protein [Saccharolobus solfataricus]AYN75755.1 CBS domain-containing protein [Saccharolobus solfataricus]AYP18589.1 CBS domain-containing protein [Saccharolobus solfataricus]AZF68152.1 CBS domain-containing protein [Saccharolobus solfataricus]AZF70772.1 CBS domain-containing protein [Saccharolobus solfataricus]